MSKIIESLPGFRDFFPNDCIHRNYIFDVWRRVAKKYGFIEYDSPVLEYTDLYKRKSGDEITKQLFCFEDKGKRDVSLRPELTPSLARMISKRQREFKKPLKWFSIGQFFRYEKQQKGRGREFYQFNCDIIGEDSIVADAEIISLSIDLMREFGFDHKGFKIKISDRNAWVNFLINKGIEGDRVNEFLQIIDKKDKLSEQKVEELLQKFDLTLYEINSFIQSGELKSENIQKILSHLNSCGMLEFVEIDLNIVRGLSYYTGVVFEVFDVNKSMRAIAGGGRYDNLIELIGKVKMNACGFAMGDMVIGEFIKNFKEPSNRLNNYISLKEKIDVYVILSDEKLETDMIKLIQELRNLEISVNFDLSKSCNIKKQLQIANTCYAKYSIIIDSKYPMLKIKSLESRVEEEINKEDAISKILSNK